MRENFTTSIPKSTTCRSTKNNIAITTSPIGYRYYILKNKLLLSVWSPDMTAGLCRSSSESKFNLVGNLNYSQLWVRLYRPPPLGYLATFRPHNFLLRCGVLSTEPRRATQSQEKRLRSASFCLFVFCFCRGPSIRRRWCRMNSLERYIAAIAFPLAALAALTYADRSVGDGGSCLRRLSVMLA